jgi:putative transposase
MKNKEPFDFERFKNEAIEGLYQGKKMGGTDGVFAPMLKHLLESMLEGELDNHLQESKATDDPNRRNGRTKKNVRSLQSGEFELESTRDRNGTFEPKIVAKRQLIITEELEDNVIAMYARGMSTRNISDYVKEMYAMDI